MIADYYSKMYKYSTIVLFLCYSSISFAQEVQFTQQSWDGVLDLSEDQGKVIFADVYTDWCAPCKMMDRDVFADRGVATYFNNHFVNYKVNAEKEGVSFANKYKVGSYPTLLFLDPQGNILYTQVGMISTFDLMAKAAEVVSFYNSRAQLSQINTARPEQYSISQIEQILKDSKNFPFDNKVAFAKRYLFEMNPISDLTLELTMDQIDNFDQVTLEKIAPMIGGFLPSVVLNDRIGRQKIKWRNELKTLMDLRIQESIRKNDFNTFEQSVQLHILLGDIYEKDVVRFYYLFYRANDLEKFAQHAEYMISSFVLSAPLDKVREEDIRRHKMLRDMDEQQMSNVIFESEMNDQSTLTPQLDSIIQIFNISENIAEQLFEVSGDFYAFYEDPVKWRKAERWAAAACVYFPYDIKFFDNHIFLLQSLGEDEKAKQVQQQMEQLPLYDEMLIKQKNRQLGFF
jgi:thioredoxin 1